MLINYCRKFFLFILLCFFISHNVLATDFVSVKEKKAILYEGPSEATKKKLIITEGYPLLVIVKLKEWLKVRDHEGKINWIKKADTSTKRTVMTIRVGVPIYNEASSNSNRLADVEDRVVLKLSSPLVTDGWANVKSELNDLKGFVSSNDIWGV
ncbi:SH3 domain-containing protein [Methylophilaceae bacterium]|nr:SH3 domain-containing protein [Methylophilaceae bacterium]